MNVTILFRHDINQLDKNIRLYEIIFDIMVFYDKHVKIKWLVDRLLELHNSRKLTNHACLHVKTIAKPHRENHMYENFGRILFLRSQTNSVFPDRSLFT